MIIGQGEMDDFLESISRNNFSENDFEIQDKDISKTNPNAIYFIEIEITVTRKSNGQQRIYQGGHLASWNSDFEDDLKLGVFGPP